MATATFAEHDATASFCIVADVGFVFGCPGDCWVSVAPSAAHSSHFIARSND
jgi:hypothetical protein